MKRTAACCSGIVLVLLLCMGVASVAYAKKVERIVSLAPHLTELVFAAGAGDRVVATVEYSDHPEAARAIPRIGDAFRVDFERLLALQPDLVLVWSSGTPGSIRERLQALGLPYRAFETQQLSDVSAVVRDIGRLAGTEAIASVAAARYEERIHALRSRYSDRSQVSVFVQVNDRPLYTINDRHILSEVVELCGGRNVFADLDQLAPAVGMESVLARNPEVILSTDAFGRPARAIWSQWATLKAVEAGTIFTISPDATARATLRLAEGTEEICRALDTARERLAARGLD